MARTTYTADNFPHLSNAQAQRTAAQINSMHPTVAERFYNSVTEFNNDPDNASQGRVIAVTEGYRSPEESDRLKISGAGRAASGGNSWHNYEAAGDVIVLTNGQWDRNNSTGAYTGKATEIFERNGLTNPYKSDDSGHFQPVEFTNRVPSGVKDGSTTVSDLLGEPNEPVTDDRFVNGDVDTGESADVVTGKWTPPNPGYQQVLDKQTEQDLADRAAAGDRQAFNDLVSAYRNEVREYHKNNPGQDKDILLEPEWMELFDKTQDPSATEADKVKMLAMTRAAEDVLTERMNNGDEQPLEVGESSPDALKTEVTDGVFLEQPEFLSAAPGIKPNWYTSVDLPTYRWTMYLVKPQIWNNPSILENEDPVLNADNAIIIAKSGTETVYTIDNFLFKAIMFGDETKGASQTSTIQFELHEPLGFTLLDAILSKSAYYKFSTFRDAKYVLKLEFLGRDSSTGQPVTYPGMHFFPIIPYQVTASTGPQGTTYILTANSSPAQGVIESVVRSGNVTVTGVTTLQNFTNNLQTKLNASEQSAIRNTAGVGSIDAAEASSNYLPRKTWKIEFGPSATVEPGRFTENGFDLRAIALKTSNSSGTATDVNDQDAIEINISQNDQLVTKLEDIITKSDAFNAYVNEASRQSRRTPVVIVESTPVYKDEIDKLSGQQYVEVVITINLIHKYNSYTEVNSEQLDNVNYQEQRFDDLPIVKKYKYLYTGENTEVTDFAVEFNNLFGVATDPANGSFTRHNTIENLPTNLPKSSFLSDINPNIFETTTRVINNVPVDITVSSDHSQQKVEDSSQPQDMLSVYAKQWDKRLSDTQILEIDIIGDPYLLGIPGNVSTESEQLRDINTESNIFVLFINYFPDNSEENFYNKGPIDLYTSGVYEVRTIDHRFTQGQFKSKLKMFRDHGTNVYMLKNRLEDR